LRINSMTVAAVFMKEEMLDFSAELSMDESEVGVVATGEVSLSLTGNRWDMSSVELDGDTRSRDRRFEDRTLASFLPGVGVKEDIKMMFLISSKVDWCAPTSL